jgi:hypothetical protein
MHGNSWLRFFNTKGKLMGAYNIGMPNELPYKLQHNNLYFRLDKRGGVSKTVLITDKLPKLLCAFDCYGLQYGG